MKTLDNLLKYGIVEKYMYILNVAKGYVTLSYKSVYNSNVCVRVPNDISQNAIKCFML